MRRFFWVVIPLALLVPVAAFSQLVADELNVGKEEIVSDNYVAFGQTVEVLGRVEGDVIAAGDAVTVDGVVTGDVLVAGRTVRVSGTVEGNVRVLAGDIELSAKVGKNLTVAGLTVVETADSDVAGTAAYAGQSVAVKGKIGKSLWVAGETVSMSGSVGSNIDAYLGEGGLLTVLKEANIGGAIRYAGTKEAVVDPSATVAGGVIRKPFPRTPEPRQAALELAYRRLVSAFGAILVGLVFVSIRRTSLHDFGRPIRERTLKTLGWGLVVLIVAPLAMLLLAYTIVGLPLVALLAATFGIIAYLAKVVVGFTVGELFMNLIIRRPADARPLSPFVHLIVGLIILVGILTIPVLGGIISFLVIILGFGSAFELVRSFISRQSRPEPPIQRDAGLTA